jgi:lysophospholipase L1-like esterase
VKPFRSLASHLLLPLAFAVVFLLVLEGGVRVMGRWRGGAWPLTRAEEGAAFSRHLRGALQRHPYLVIAGIPGGGLEIPGHSVRMNSRGYRGPEIRMPKPAGRYRVVCTGGSTTFDVRSPDDEKTWPSRLGARLVASDGDVVNAGVSGWTTLESLISLEARDIDLEPDLVVVYAGVNDAQPAGFSPFARDYSHGHGEILARVVGVEDTPIPFVSHSLLIQSLGDALRQGPAKVHAMPWKTAGNRAADIPDEAAAVFERNLRSTIAVARAAGARTLVIAQSVRLRKGYEAADREYYESWTPGLTFEGAGRALARYNEVGRRLGQEGAAFFLDPFASGAFTDADFADSVHFSVSGSDRFAGLLAAYLETPEGPRKSR